MVTDIYFKRHSADYAAHLIGRGRQYHLEVYFENGYGASILLGDMFYSDGVSTVEVGVLKNGQLHYDNEVARGDVVGYVPVDHLPAMLSLISMWDSDGDRHERT